MIKPVNDDRYKFQMVRIVARWVDWCRIREVFPAFKDESAKDYIKRLADKLQLMHQRGEI